MCRDMFVYDSENGRLLLSLVLEVCNLTTKPAALFPFSDQYQGHEAMKLNLTAQMSNIKYGAGIHGEPNGAVGFNGEHDSFIDIEANSQVQFDQSMTILLHVYPRKSSTGPLLHYNAHGVQIWIEGTIDKTSLMARFVRRNSSNSSWLKTDKLCLTSWNFIGASYNHVTGWAYLFHDGLEVARMFIAKNALQGMSHEIRLGAVAIPSPRTYEGAVACLQLYSKALDTKEVLEAKDACNPGKECFMHSLLCN